MPKNKASSFNKKKCNAFEDLVAIGLSLENAAVRGFGINRSTYYLWTGEHSPLNSRQKIDLTTAIERGRADLNNRLSLYVLGHAKNDGKLALDYLKRLEAKTYGDSRKLVGDSDNPVEVNHSFSDDQLRRILSKPTEDEDTGNN